MCRRLVLSKEARNKHEELIQKLAIKKDGYIETYLVNETSENVWFDQFRIMSTGPLIVQETYYDPWGVDLSGLGYQYGGIKINPYLYNGKKLTSGLGVIMYDYGARLYIPAIGKWFVTDPLAEKARRQSPYNYALNNPLRFIDPDGMQAYSIQGTPVTSGESAASEEEEDVLFSNGYSDQSLNSDTGAISLNGGYQTVFNLAVPSAGDPTIFVSFNVTPKGMNKNEYYNELKKKLIEEGFNPKLQVQENSILGKFKAWWNDSPTSQITIKNFDLRTDAIEAGGYAYRDDPNSIVIYNGLSHIRSNQIVPLWRYINASLHEIGHGLFVPMEMPEKNPILTELMRNGEFYTSPKEFYRKNGFEIRRDTQLKNENINGIKVIWSLKRTENG